jgi:hypothetical protein
MIEAWYFSKRDKKLRYGDNRQIRVGITHKVKGELKLCKKGLHASKNILDALNFAPSSYIWRVELSGEIIEDDNKLCASERKYLWGFSASKVLEEFSRWCALEVVHLWKAPEVVIKYLKTGDPALKEEACKLIKDANFNFDSDAAYFNFDTDAAASSYYAAVAISNASNGSNYIKFRKKQEAKLLEMIMEKRKCLIYKKSNSS